MAASHLTLSTEVRTFKELFFGIWGYGWDGWHYLTIATTGYHFPNQAFFPLYPLLIRALDVFLPLSVSYRLNLILLPILLLTLIRLMTYLNIRNKVMALSAFLFFPTAFFLQANYAETLFILLSALFFISLFQHRYNWATLICALATATKPQGVVLALILLVAQIRPLLSLRLNLSLTLQLLSRTFLSLSGLVAYFTYLHLKFGSFTIFFETQREWFRGGSNPFINFWMTINEAWRMVMVFLTEFPVIPREILDITVLFFLLVMLYLTFKKMRWELWSYSLLMILMPLFSGGTISLPRFALTAFPLLLVFGDKIATRPLMLITYFGICFTLQAILILMFFNNAFVA